MAKKIVLVVLLLLLVLAIAFLGQWYADKRHNLETKTFALGQGVKLEMIRLPAGTFRMGSADNWFSFIPGTEERGYQYIENETPAHMVKLSEFWMGKYEVTQEQYKAVMGNNPSDFKGAKNPVEQVSWDDAVAFCKALSKQTGTSFTLPTEAQWEYACRAASTTAYCFGNSESALKDYAWVGLQTGGSTHPVGQMKPNAWGFYDMHGNVFEWCRDYYDEKFYSTSAATMKNPENTKTTDFRVLRGGSWGLIAPYCRSAYRSFNAPDSRGKTYYFGFRIVRTQP